MPLHIPTSYDVDVDVDVNSLPTIVVGSVGPVTIDGIPDDYTIDTTNKINITNLPKIAISIDPLEIKPIDLSIRLMEIPSVRAHLPVNYCVGLSLLGFELANVRLCGESQIITEPFRPNPCEVCGPTGYTGSLEPATDPDKLIGLREG